MVHRPAFSLIEMLLVLACLVILFALLMPAIQRVRVLSTRAACANNLKQQGMAIHEFATMNRGCVPMLGEASAGAHWTAFILPYIEQDSLYKMLSFGNTNEGPNYAKASGNFYPPPNSSDGTDRNMAACRQNIKTYRCPASTLVSPILDASAYRPVWFCVRMPCNYLGVVTGLQPHDGREGGPIPGAKGLAAMDGVFVIRPHPNNWVGLGGTGGPVRLQEIPDSMSNTLMIGEAEPDPYLPLIAGLQENLNVGRKDHWYIGGDDMDNYEGIDWSECGGSTAVRINYPRPTDLPTHPNLTTIDADLNWGAYEVSFGSRHGGGANFVFADGAVKYLRETITPETFSALGTRAGNIPPGDY